MENGFMENKNIKIAKTATESLKILWQEGFFKTRQKNQKIVDRLAKEGNYFSSAELGMALKRAKYLTCMGKRGNYEYIQKYPYVKGKVIKSK